MNRIAQVVVAAGSLAALVWGAATLEVTSAFAALSAAITTLFVACYLASKLMVRVISMPYAFRLRENFGPRALRMQVVTYASFHTTLLADLTHVGLAADAVAWSVLTYLVFGPAGLVAVGALAVAQVLSYRDERFARIAIPVWAFVIVAAMVVVASVDRRLAGLLAAGTVLVTGVWRVVGHAGEPIPPGVSGTNGFVSLEDMGFRPTVGLSAAVGVVAEAASGLPFRLFNPWLYDSAVRHLGMSFDTQLGRKEILEQRRAIFDVGWGGAPATRYLLTIDEPVRKPQDRPSSLPPFPSGWYAVGFCEDLAPGQLTSMTFCGSEVVVFRTASGRVAAIDAYCPHLGAHIGIGGAVEGESVRCPFHGFCFDADGTCVATGYGTTPPRGLRAETLPVVEVDGVILVWHDASGSPAWFEIPETDHVAGRRVHAQHLIRDHPQETTENSVDLGHFSHVHSYGAVEIVEPLDVDGPMLSIGYRAERVMPWTRKPYVFEFRPEVYGLGVSRVRVDVPDQGIRAHLLVMPTPTDGRHVELRLALDLEPVRKRALHPLAVLLPTAVLERIVASFILKAFSGDAGDDFPIWENKAYIDRPRLARGDGPIGRYREWARQFYPEIDRKQDRITIDLREMPVAERQIER